MHRALHTLVLMGPPWYLGAAVANFVAARAFGGHTYACEGVIRMFGNLRQRAPTLAVVSVVKCPRLAIGLAVSIERWPELPGLQSRGGPRWLAAELPSSEKGRYRAKYSRMGKCRLRSRGYQFSDLALRSENW